MKTIALYFHYHEYGWVVKLKKYLRDCTQATIVPLAIILITVKRGVLWPSYCLLCLSYIIICFMKYEKKKKESNPHLANFPSSPVFFCRKKSLFERKTQCSNKIIMKGRFFLTHFPSYSPPLHKPAVSIARVY